MERVRKAKAGELIEKKPKKGPPKGLNLRTFKVFVDNESFEVGVEDGAGGAPVVSYVQPGAASQPAASTQTPAAAPPVPTPPPTDPEPAAAAEEDVKGNPLKAPMPGLIISVEVKVGDTVQEGDPVLVLEAMKRENSIPAPVSGTIKAVYFGSGDSVNKDDTVCVIG